MRLQEIIKEKEDKINKLDTLLSKNVKTTGSLPNYFFFQSPEPVKAVALGQLPEATALTRTLSKSN
jgi:hypothetical protein